MPKRSVKRGEIYYYDFGKSNGSVQGGIRPALVIQGDTANENSKTTVIAAVTTHFWKPHLSSHIGKDKGLVANSCDFRFLEQKCQEYILAEEKTEAAQARPQDFQEQTTPEAARPNHKASVRDRLAQLRQDTLRGDQLPERNERDPR